MKVSSQDLDLIEKEALGILSNLQRNYPGCVREGVEDIRAIVTKIRSTAEPEDALPYSAQLKQRGAPDAEVKAAERVETLHQSVGKVFLDIKEKSMDRPHALGSDGTEAPPNPEASVQSALTWIKKFWKGYEWAGVTRQEAEDITQTFEALAKYDLSEDESQCTECGSLISSHDFGLTVCELCTEGSALLRGAPSRRLNVEEILKLVCLHTGLRVSLDQKQLDEYIAFAHAVETLRQSPDPELLRLAERAVSVSDALAADPDACLKAAEAFFPEDAPSHADGMPTSQEPKYGIRGNRLFNRASGEFIPDDEPVFIFRARDSQARHALAYYMNRFGPGDHRVAVESRVRDFNSFTLMHPERMKWPDTEKNFACGTCGGKGQTRIMGRSSWRQCPDCNKN